MGKLGEARFSGPLIFLILPFFLKKLSCPLRDISFIDVFPRMSVMEVFPDPTEVMVNNVPLGPPEIIVGEQ